MINMAKRHYKKNRKAMSPLDSAYQSYSRLWSKEFGKGNTERMDKETFIFFVRQKRIDTQDKEALLKAAQQRVASAAHRLTNTQAKNLKRELLNLSDADLEVIGMSRQDVKAMTLEAMRFLPSTEKGKAMISQFYLILKEQGLSIDEAGQWISSEIYGSD